MSPQNKSCGCYYPALLQKLGRGREAGKVTATIVMMLLAEVVTLTIPTLQMNQLRLGEVSRPNGRVSP